MAEVPINAPQFAETIRNSVAVIEHVWEQAGVLKELLDKKLPPALDAMQPIGIRCTSPSRNESYQLDASEGIYVAWMWRYDLRQRNRHKGRNPDLAHLYVLIRLAPAAGVPADTFVPHLAVFVDYPSIQVADVGEHGIDEHVTCVDAWKEDGHRQVDLPDVPEAVFCVAEYYDPADLENCGAAMFVTLAGIDSTNLDATIVAPAVSLVEHCRKLWSANAVEDGGQ